MQRTSVSPILASSVGLGAGSAAAVPITMVHSGNGSGTLGGVAFGFSHFTITALADTDRTGSMLPWDRAPLINTSGGVLVVTRALAGTTTWGAQGPKPRPRAG